MITRDTIPAALAPWVIVTEAGDLACRACTAVPDTMLYHRDGCPVEAHEATLRVLQSVVLGLSYGTTILGPAGRARRDRLGIVQAAAYGMRAAQLLAPSESNTMQAALRVVADGYEMPKTQMDAP